MTNGATIPSTDRTKATRRFEAVIAAVTDVWRNGASAVTSPNATYVGVVGGRTAAFNAALQDAKALRDTVTADGSTIASAALSIQQVHVREASEGTYAAANVLVTITSNEPGVATPVETSWEDPFEILTSAVEYDSGGRVTASDTGIGDVQRTWETGGSDEWGAESPDEIPSSTVESTTSSASAMSMQAASVPVYSYNRDDFTDYLLYWTRSPRQNKMNPDYFSYDNNCANFISQALDKAGWAQTGGFNPKNANNWDANLTGPYKASYSWSRAQKLYRYAVDKKNLRRMGNIWDARPGDLYFVDWGADKDKKIDHVAAVTAGPGTARMPRISQKTANRHNMKLSTWLKIIRSGKNGSQYHFYALHSYTAD